jgi:hypothetical protein
VANTHPKAVVETFTNIAMGHAEQVGLALPGVRVVALGPYRLSSIEPRVFDAQQ